jgi:hypothetical protein
MLLLLAKSSHEPRATQPRSGGRRGRRGRDRFRRNPAAPEGSRATAFTIAHSVPDPRCGGRSQSPTSRRGVGSGAVASLVLLRHARRFRSYHRGRERFAFGFAWNERRQPRSRAWCQQPGRPRCSHAGAQARGMCRFDRKHKQPAETVSALAPTARRHLGDCASPMVAAGELRPTAASSVGACSRTDLS